MFCANCIDADAKTTVDYNGKRLQMCLVCASNFRKINESVELQAVIRQIRVDHEQRTRDWARRDDMRQITTKTAGPQCRSIRLCHDEYDQTLGADAFMNRGGCAA